MKKCLSLFLVFILFLSLTACGGDKKATSSNDDKIDVMDLAEKVAKDAIAKNAFSTEASDAAMKYVAGLGLDDLKPEFKYILDDDTMANYGDAGSYGKHHFSLLKTAEI